MFPRKRCLVIPALRRMVLAPCSGAHQRSGFHYGRLAWEVLKGAKPRGERLGRWGCFSSRLPPDKELWRCPHPDVIFSPREPSVTAEMWGTTRSRLGRPINYCAVTDNRWWRRPAAGRQCHGDSRRKGGFVEGVKVRFWGGPLDGWKHRFAGLPASQFLLPRDRSGRYILSDRTPGGLFQNGAQDLVYVWRMRNRATAT